MAHHDNLTSLPNRILFDQRLIETIRPLINVEGQNLSVGLSVGIALTSQTINTPEHILRCADMALYEAKHNGRNRYEHFTLEVDDLARSRRVIENDLCEAITGRQLKL